MKFATIFGALMLLSMPASAQDEATKARVRAQIEAAANAKRATAAAANKQDAGQVARDKSAVDAKAAAAKAKVDKASASFGWIYGPEHAGAKGDQLKQQVNAAADEQKAKIAADAARRAAQRNKAAEKQVQSLVDSAKGLKSQVPTKKGEFGVQPSGTNLHVRNYGTAK
jgi:hypothetical protein